MPLAPSQEGMVEAQEIAIVTDPPYGINYQHSGGGHGRHHRTNLQPIQGDADPFDPAPLLTFKEVICWGANHYAKRLPESGRWLVWNKLAGMEQYDSFSDCEIAWHSEHGPERLFSVRWKGICRTEEEKANVKTHPSQKPVALMKWCIQQLKGSGQTILDPYMGSGTTGIACIRTGRKFIGIEICREYFEIACERIRRELSQGQLPIVENKPAPESSLLPGM